MLGVACASPRTSTHSSWLWRPLPMPLSFLGHCSLLNQQEGRVVFYRLKSQTVQGQSKTSMSHGRGGQSETQDAGAWWLQDMLLSTAACETRGPNPTDCLLPSPVCQLERSLNTESFWSSLAELSSSWAAQRLHKPPPGKTPQSLSQK